MLPHLIFLTPLAVVLVMAWRQLPRVRTAGVVREEIERHRAVLRGKWLRAHDEYGSFDREEWRHEADYFARSVILPRLPASQRWNERRLARFSRDVARRALAAVCNADEALRDELRDDPIAFEHRCAEILRSRGWDARPVGGSGDQGADVIATANGHTLIVQCKQWNKPIGNKAVQEATAARAFYKADMAAVVGTAPFTKSAYELAKATNVLLTDEAGLATLPPPSPK